MAASDDAAKPLGSKPTQEGKRKAEPRTTAKQKEKVDTYGVQDSRGMLPRELPDDCLQVIAWQGSALEHLTREAQPCPRETNYLPIVLHSRVKTNISFYFSSLS